MSGVTTPKQEAAAFTDLVEKTINAFRKDEKVGRTVEAAVIELELQHTRHVNAMKRQYNADLEKLEKAQKSDLAVLAEREEANEKRFEQKLKDITEDYKRQLASSSTSYQAGLAKMKLHYENMLAEKAYHGRFVTQLQEDHAREIKRLTAEHARITENKEKEIDALNRKLSEVLANAAEEMAVMDTRRCVSEDENAALRRELAETQAALSSKDDAIGTVLRQSLEDKERVVALCKKLLSDVLSSVAEVELELSKMRATVIANNFESARRRIRESEVRAEEKRSASRESSQSTPAASSHTQVALELAQMEAAEEEGRLQLEKLMDGVYERQAAQRGLVAVCESRMEDEAGRVREEYHRQQQELGRDRTRREEPGRDRRISRLNSESFLSFLRGIQGPSDAASSLKDGGMDIRDIRARRKSRAASIMSACSSSAQPPTYGKSPSPSILKTSPVHRDANGVSPRKLDMSEAGGQV